MPHGKVHFATEALVGGSLLVAYSTPSVRELLPPETPHGAILGFLIGYIFALFFIGPDLDLRHSEKKRRWGPLAFLWHPYHKMFKHRGLSHSLIFGTATRLMYLFVILIIPGLLVLALGLDAGWIYASDLLPWNLARLLPGVLGFLLGCYVNEAVHILTDHWDTLRKRRLRAGRRPRWKRWLT